MAKLEQQTVNTVINLWRVPDKPMYVWQATVHVPGKIGRANVFVCAENATQAVMVATYEIDGGAVESLQVLGKCEGFAASA